MKTSHIAIIAAAALTSASLVGCACGSDGSESEETTEAKATGAAKEEAPKEEAKLEMNAEAVEHLEAIVKGCKVKEDRVQAYSCKDSEKNKMRKWARDKDPTNLYETLGEVALGDDKKKAAAALVMADSLWSVGGDDFKKGNGSKAATDRFIKLAKMEGEVGEKAAPFAVHFGMMNDRKDEVFKLVEAHKDDEVKAAAYESYMTFGRLDGFKQLEKVSKGLEDKKLIRAALKAPRNMYKDTDAEKAAFCPWAAAYIEDEDLDIAADSARVLVKCKGEYIDTMIKEGEERVEAGQFKRPFSQVYREPCFSVMKKLDKEAGTKAQCDKLFTFLEAVANNDKVDSKVRGLSLWNIYYQRRDQETLDLMRKYENHKDEEISKRAKDAIKSLTTTYKLK